MVPVGHGGSLRKNVEICGIRVMSRWLLDVYPTQCALTEKVWTRNGQRNALKYQALVP